MAAIAIAMNGLASPINATLSYEDMSKEEAEAEAVHHMKQSELNKTWGRAYRHPVVVCFAVLIPWFATGITWYVQWHGWNFWLAFSYQVQACFSVGYRTPTDDDLCDLAPNEMDHLHDTVKYYILAPGMQYPKPEEGGRGGCVAGDISKAVTTLLVLSGSVIIATTVGALAQSFTSPKGGWYKKLIKHQHLQELKRKAEETEGWADDVAIYLRILVNTNSFKALCALLVWIAVGVAWGMLSAQRMSFLTALYFSVSSISTAGNEPILSLGSDTPIGAQVKLLEVDQGVWAFAGIFVLFGFPLYAWALSALASGYVEAVTAVDRNTALYQQISEEEFHLMDNLGYLNAEGGGDGQIDMFEFVECQLLRLNMVSVNQLFDIKKRFIELDLDGGGSIDRDELMAHDEAGVVHKPNPKIQHAFTALEVIQNEIKSRKEARAKMTVQQKKQDLDATTAAALKSVNEARLNKSWSRMYKTAWFKCLVFFLLWTASGCLFYTLWQGWDFWLALYFTIQTGMSVGFGNPSEDSLCYASDDRIPAGVWHYVKGDGMQYTPISENGRGGCMAGDISKLFSVILILIGSSVIASAIGIIANALLNPPGGWYKKLIKEEELKHLRQRAAETEGWADDVAINIKIFLRKGIVKSIIALNLWIAVGVIYGCFSLQRMTFVTAYYFSVTAIATGGLEGLKYLGEMTDTPKGASIAFDELPGWNWAFCTVYLLIGIPMYGWAFTEIAAFSTSHINRMMTRDVLYSSITEEEFRLMDYLGEGEGDGTVDMFEFVECQLLRLNLVSVNDLFDIKRRFLELDLDGGGTIDRSELMAAGSGGGSVDEKMMYALKAMKGMHREMDAMIKLRLEHPAHQHHGKEGRNLFKVYAPVETDESDPNFPNFLPNHKLKTPPISPPPPAAPARNRSSVLAIVADTGFVSAIAPPRLLRTGQTISSMPTAAGSPGPSTGPGHSFFPYPHHAARAIPPSPSPAVSTMGSFRDHILMNAASPGPIRGLATSSIQSLSSASVVDGVASPYREMNQAYLVQSPMDDMISVHHHHPDALPGEFPVYVRDDVDLSP